MPRLHNLHLFKEVKEITCKRDERSLTHPVVSTTPSFRSGSWKPLGHVAGHHCLGAVDRFSRYNRPGIDRRLAHSARFQEFEYLDGHPAPCQFPRVLCLHAQLLPPPTTPDPKRDRIHLPPVPKKQLPLLQVPRIARPRLAASILNFTNGHAPLQFPFPRYRPREGRSVYNAYPVQVLDLSGASPRPRAYGPCSQCP